MLGYQRGTFLRPKTAEFPQEHGLLFHLYRTWTRFCSYKLFSHFQFFNSPNYNSCYYSII